MPLFTSTQHGLPSTAPGGACLHCSAQQQAQDGLLSHRASVEDETTRPRDPVVSSMVTFNGKQGLSRCQACTCSQRGSTRTGHTFIAGHVGGHALTQRTRFGQ